MTLLCSSLPIKSRLHLLRRRRCIVADYIVEPTSGNCQNDSSRSGPVHSNPKQKFHRTMSTGSTRAAAAATSRHVKQKLVKLLFQEKNNSGMSFNSLDHFSYDDLRREYLKRLQLIHPDKINANSINANRRRGRSQQHDTNDDSLLYSKEALKREFQDLQSTWDKYEELTKSMAKVISGDGATANFTKFGVGCSFSDNEEERALRTEITDQACRGWFSSGLVSSGLSAENDRQGSTKNRVSALSNFTSEKKSLIDDSMFVQEEGRYKHDNFGALSQETKPRSNPHRRQRTTLIPGIN